MIHIPPFIIERLSNHPGIWVGLSGGLDSVVLLHALVQVPAFQSKLKVIHVNHGLSENANHWQDFCASVCERYGLAFYSESLHLKLSSNLEAIARASRYDAFKKCLGSDDALVLAHHLDDQIETFFLNALRGSGIDGLASMPYYYQSRDIHIYRPLLAYGREALEDCAKSAHLSWVVDESNLSNQFSRNYLRNEILPLIEKRWPQYRQSLSHTINHCQETRTYQRVALMPYMDKKGYLLVSLLEGLNHYTFAKVIREYFNQKGLTQPNQKVLREILRQLIVPKRGDTEACIRYADWALSTYDDRLYLRLVKKPLTNQTWLDFPNDIEIMGLGVLSVISPLEYPKGSIEIRFRVGGEKIFLRGQHKCLKKLFQRVRLPPFMRDEVPLLYVNNELKSIVGYCNADDFKPKIQLYPF